MKLQEITDKYIKSSQFKSLRAGSKTTYINSMRHLKPLMNREADEISRRVIMNMRDRMYDTPGAAREAFKVLSNIYTFGYDNGYTTHNPAQRVRGLPKEKPHPRWEKDEIERFLSNAKDAYVVRAFILALYTGQRSCDLVAMRWDDYDDDGIRLVQQKTGKELILPVHPVLAKSLAESRKEYRFNKKRWPIFLITNAHGHKWASASLSSSITHNARRIGIKGKSIHGLRKTCAAMMAEAGCTTLEIMSITGHTSIKEVERYTTEANQKRMAQEAMRKFKETFGNE